MPKKTIAVDLDDVLSITIPAFVQFSNKRWDMDLTIDTYDENWARTWDVQGEELIKRTEIIKNEFWHTIKHSETAWPVLKKLSEDYKLVVATSRRRDVSKHTSDWINKYFEGIFEEIHHSGIFDIDKRRLDLYNKASTATKARLCREIGADYLVDDHIKHCIGADAVGVKALLFGNHPWNKGVEVPKTVVRISDWQELGEYFARQRR